LELFGIWLLEFNLSELGKVCQDIRRACKNRSKKLEETRLLRVKEEIPMLSLKERQELLQGFHPDYREGGRREIKAGVNKGEKVPMNWPICLKERVWFDPKKWTSPI